MTFSRPFTLVLATLVGITSADRAHADTFGSGVNAFDINFVPIGNPGNAADLTGLVQPVGSVAYPFRMGQFEVSEQMIEKANVLGGLGIMPIARGPDKPATSVSWNAAARFVNWLNASTGHPLAYKFDLQPGDIGYHSNQNILLWDVSDPGYDANNRFRNSRARYVLPSSDEWHKAAYFDAASGVYFDYPTGSNVAPTGVASGVAPSTAVYNGQLGPADITLAGGLSTYGTMGQGGNAAEWQETDPDFVNDSVLSTRVIRGGSWNTNSNILHASNWGNGVPGNGAIIGFRVASVPEPSTALLGAMTAVAVTMRRKRLR
jgi:sulfatase modifying factor 1